MCRGVAAASELGVARGCDEGIAALAAAPLLCCGAALGVSALLLAALFVLVVAGQDAMQSKAQRRDGKADQGRAWRGQVGEGAGGWLSGCRPLLDLAGSRPSPTPPLPLPHALLMVRRSCTSRVSSTVWLPAGSG